jgi:hypothetical protein
MCTYISKKKLENGKSKRTGKIGRQREGETGRGILADIYM